MCLTLDCRCGLLVCLTCWGGSLLQVVTLAHSLHSHHYRTELGVWNVTANICRPAGWADMERELRKTSLKDNKEDARSHTVRPWKAVPCAWREVCAAVLCARSWHSCWRRIRILLESNKPPEPCSSLAKGFALKMPHRGYWFILPWLWVEA